MVGWWENIFCRGDKLMRCRENRYGQFLHQFKRSYMRMYTKASWPPVTSKVSKLTSENDRRRLLDTAVEYSNTQQHSKDNYHGHFIQNFCHQKVVVTILLINNKVWHTLLVWTLLNGSEGVPPPPINPRSWLVLASYTSTNCTQWIAHIK